MDNYSFLNSISSEHLESLYTEYLKNPDKTEPSLRAFFSGFDFALENYGTSVLDDNKKFLEEQNSAKVPDSIKKEFQVIDLIRGYRERGHLFTRTNPVREFRKFTPNLDIENFGLSKQDLQTRFSASARIGLRAGETLETILKQLDAIYCESNGIEYNYLREPHVVRWIEDWIFKNQNKPELSIEDKHNILYKLNQGVAFENFLHTRYVGQKRFSLEGLEALIPALDTLINHSCEQGVEEIVLGMAHRGRLGVLTNIFEKPFEDIFTEFEGKELDDDFVDGDVKYHNGWVCDKLTRTGKRVKMHLLPNPSHLETVDPVVEGFSRAEIDRKYSSDWSKVLPVLIHGDSALATQGIIYEVLQMSLLEGYKTGGTIHIVTNNQIGFTTHYSEARSSTYCTDIAKTTLSPVMHVNADDPQAVVHALNFAVDFRQKFAKDVFIDLLGYRRYGHNEGDEPRFTQPLLYKIIASHPNVWEIYLKKLVSKGEITELKAREYDEKFREKLEDSYQKALKKEKTPVVPFLEDVWKDYKLAHKDDVFEPQVTSVDKETLKKLAVQMTSLPEGKKVIGKIEKLLEDRRNLVLNGQNIDWGMGELLTYASILNEGQDVRLSGEDVERGTFSHRHAVLREEDSEAKISPLNLLSAKQGKFYIYNSPLSEYGVLGYEYGYAMVSPESLVIWEAQFGDFANGAQTIIDQYVSAAEDKWKVQNGVVILLPHGYEGQGAEHSSARIERFLQLCAKDNMIVCNCTTPAQFFHLLRLQQKRSFRKPLIIFTPKSLLRNPLCVSSLDDFSNGFFKRIIDDQSIVEKHNVNRVVFCSGKFYYDLLTERQKLERTKDVALVRVEQLYPLKDSDLNDIINLYPNAKEIIWAQEEPENMGAWSYILRKFTGVKFKLCAPSESAAPAPGSGKRWQKRHRKALEDVFA